MNKKNKRINNKNKNKKNNNNNSNKYSAENEIIIGVTTKPKEKARVVKKTTRVNEKNNKDKKTKSGIIRKKEINKNRRIKKNNENYTKDFIKKKNKKKTMLIIELLLLLIVGITIYYMTTPVFNVTNVIISGNNRNSEETYISLSKIIIGETNIFAFTENSIENNLKENAYVENISLKRKLPNIIEINITERQITYQIEYKNNYIYLDKQGYILEINQDNKDIPTIKGIDTIRQDVKVGQRLNNNDLIKLDVVLKIVNYFKYNNLENKITSIDVNDVNNYILDFDDEAKKAYIGNSTSLTEKLTAVSKILLNEKGKKGEIFADEDALKRNRIYFREER